MTEDLVVKCKLLVQNRDILKNEFQWASTNMIPLCAYYYAEEGKRVDAVRMKECLGLLKRNSGVFTKVKGEDNYPFAAMLALEKNTNKALEERARIYQMLTTSYEPSEWLTMASFILAREAEKISCEEVMKRAAFIEGVIKQEDSTISLNRILYLLLALSKKEDPLLILDLKESLELLEEITAEKEAKALLAVIISLGNEVPEKIVHKLKEVIALVRQNQLSTGTGIELVGWGLLANSEGTMKSLVTKLEEVNGYLKEQKGFKPLYLATGERLMYASMLAADTQEKHFMDQQVALLGMFFDVHMLSVVD